MRRLYFPHLALYPILEAKVMNKFHTSSAIANIEKRVVFVGCCIKAKPADGFIGSFREHAFLEVVVAGD